MGSQWEGNKLRTNGSKSSRNLQKVALRRENGLTVKKQVAIEDGEDVVDADGCVLVDRESAESCTGIENPLRSLGREHLVFVFFLMKLGACEL